MCFRNNYVMTVAVICLAACSQNPDAVATGDLTNSPAPSPIEVLTPGDNFVVGSALALADPVSAETVTVAGFIRLPQAADVQAPLVKINNQIVSASLVNDQATCATQAGVSCYAFSSDFTLSKGKYQFTISASDVNGNQFSKMIRGVVDYCRIENKDPGVLAEVQDNPNIAQGNRCHEIDGCSVYITPNDPLATSDARNNPMLGNNNKAVASTAFGAGSLPISEFFVHGQKPNDALPCNLHDVCYQTTASNKDSCDRNMLSAMKNVCAAAYPKNPYASASADYLTWEAQRAACYTYAESYYAGVQVGGDSVFTQRKDDYKP